MATIDDGRAQLLAGRNDAWQADELLRRGKIDELLLLPSSALSASSAVKALPLAGCSSYGAS